MPRERGQLDDGQGQPLLWNPEAKNNSLDVVSIQLPT